MFEAVIAAVLAGIVIAIVVVVVGLANGAVALGGSQAVTLNGGTVAAIAAWAGAPTWPVQPGLVGDDRRRLRGTGQHPARSDGLRRCRLRMIVSMAG